MIIKNKNMSDEQIAQMLSQLLGIGQLSGLGLGTGVRIGPIMTTMTEAIQEPTPDLLDSCPGLNMMHNARYKWTVPHDGAVDETYCNQCATSLHIDGSYKQSNKATYCHGYLKSNKADNGVFNVSFWKPDLKEHYDAVSSDTSVSRSTAPVNCIMIPSGGQFNVLLHSKNPKKQFFRYEIYLLDGFTDTEYLVYSESKHYTEQSCMVSASNNVTKFVYIDSCDPRWESITLKDRIDNGIFRAGDMFIVKFHVYNVTEHLFTKDSYRNIGKFKLTSNNTITSCPDPDTILDTQQDTFHKNPYQILPTSEYVKFTIVPITMKFALLTDYDTPDTSDKYLTMVLDKQIKAELEAISKSESSIRKCDLRIKTHQQHKDDIVEQLEKQRTVLTQLETLKKKAQ
jgi:hypothetical protein